MATKKTAKRRSAGSRKGKGNNNGFDNKNPLALIVAIVLIAGLYVTGGGSLGSLGTPDSGSAGNGTQIEQTYDGTYGYGEDGGSQTSASDDASAGTSAETGSSGVSDSGSSTSSTSASGDYEATAWDESLYPNYVREAGAAIVTDEPAAGEVVYGGLDSLGRATAVTATVTYKMYDDSRGWREEFDSDAKNNVAGWKYDGKSNNKQVSIEMPTGSTYNGYFYNRSHLLADSLGGAATRENLVTGTRTQNVGANDGNGGMAYTETMARDWLASNPDGTIYYKATPVYVGDELLPRSVYVDIKTSDGSIDKHVEVFNAAKGYTIDYATGQFSAN